MIGKIGSTIASRSSFAQVTHETHHKNQEVSEQIEEIQQNQQYTEFNTYENSLTPEIQRKNLMLKLLPANKKIDTNSPKHHVNSSVKFDSLSSERSASDCPDEWVADWLGVHSVGSSNETIIESIINTVNEYGSTSACTAIGQLYLSDLIPANHEEAMRWFLRAADRDDVTACFQLGMLHYMSPSIKRDLQAAINWHKKADRLGQGLFIAQIEIFKLTQELHWQACVDLMNKDYASARDKFVFLEAEGNINARYQLSLMRKDELI